MRKIPTLFERDAEGRRLVTPVVVAEAAWVLAGEGVATVKWDGTACLWREAMLWKRYDAHQGAPPPQFLPAESEPNPPTGHWFGWLPIGAGPEDRWHLEALQNSIQTLQRGATYELVGPKVQGNPHHLLCHELMRHGAVVLDAPREFALLGHYLAFVPVEGIVWHHPDGRMAKLKRRDFGLPWPEGR